MHKKYEYKRHNVDPINGAQGTGVDGMLNKYAEDGWRVVGILALDADVVLLEREFPVYEKLDESVQYLQQLIQLLNEHTDETLGSNGEMNRKNLSC